MEDVTGLHAFDHLDPVSALNVLPDEPEPSPEPVRQPQRSVPPPVSRSAASVHVPAARGRSLPPPPPPRGGPAGLSVPPPPMRQSLPPTTLPPASSRPNAGSMSQAPTLPGHNTAGALRVSQVGRVPVASPSSPSWARARASADAVSGRSRSPVVEGELTQRVELPRSEDDTRVSNDSDDGEPTSLIHMGGGHGETLDSLRHSHPPMDLSATTVAAAIDMDWDEDEEPQTNMRDELQSGIPPRSSSMDFDPVMHVRAQAPASFSPPAAAATRQSLVPPRHSTAPAGEPSPFVLASRAPVAGPSAGAVPSWEEDAQTNYLPPQSHFTTTEQAWQRPRSNTDEIDFEHEPSRLRASLPWLGLAAVLAVGLAFGVRAMMAPPALATVTLVTQPADAEVSVDGRPLVGQASPFTIQGLSPESEHSLVVRSEGFADEKSRFRVEAGETKALSNVALKAVRVDTGFVLTSQPAGAAVFIDGESRDLVTPARITDLAPGLHTVRLERGDGYQPWETQVALAAGQVLELADAQLAPAAPAAQDSATARSEGKSARSAASAGRGERKVSRAEEARLERKARRAEKRAARTEAKAVAAASRQPRGAAVALAKAQKAPAAVARPMPAANGGGMLRVNSRPWSQVFVDGRLVGNTPQLGIQLSPGTHKLKLVSPDLGMTKQMSIKIAKGQTVTKVINLIE